MKNHQSIEEEAEKRFREKERRKRRRMKVSGKSVFALRTLLAKNPPKSISRKLKR